MATQSEAVSFISGQVHALAAFAVVMANLHPRREELRRHFEVASQMFLSSVENSEATDKAIEGFLDIQKRLFVGMQDDPGTD